MNSRKIILGCFSVFFSGLLIKTALRTAGAASYPGQQILITSTSPLQGSVTTVSTATFCAVLVSTGNATRMDNFNSTVGCEGLLIPRTEIKLCSPTGSPIVNFGYSNLVSTLATSVRLGEELAAGVCKDLSVNGTVSVFGMSQGIVASTVVVTQVRP